MLLLGNTFVGELGERARALLYASFLHCKFGGFSSTVFGESFFLSFSFLLQQNGHYKVAVLLKVVCRIYW